MKVRELMTSPAYSVGPHDTLHHAAGLLWEHDIGALAVVDDAGRVGATITDRDICMAAMLRGLPLALMRVSEAMSDGIVTCRADDDVDLAAARLRERQLHRLPVVDADGRAIGMLSLNDLVLAGTSRPALAAASQAALRAVCRHRNGLPALVPGELPHDVRTSATLA